MCFRLKIFLSIYFLLLIAVYVTAQEPASVSGKITDKSDGSALIGANIYLKGTTKGASSDMEGNFLINLIKPGVYDIEITYMGYKKTVLTAQKLLAGQKKILNIALEPTSLAFDQEIVIVGEKPLIDIDKSKTETNISSEKIEAAPVRQLSQLLNTQAGIINTPSGMHIRGGRTYETGFFIDGVSAKDPLAGTGLGLDVGSNSIQELEITTGGVDVEFGNSTSGTVNTRTKSGGDKYEMAVSLKKDNFGINNDWNSVFNQDVFEFNAGGPLKKLRNILPGDDHRKLTFFTTLQFSFSDTYIKNPAEQIHSSILNSDFWSPRQDNRWSGFLKFNYDLDVKKKLSITYLKSLNINQDINMLRVTGNDVGYTPGYQFNFHLDPDNAATFTHESNMQVVKWNQTLNNRFSYQLTGSRLFVHLRGDANGRKWRPDEVNTEFDPASIVEFPVQYFNPEEEVVFTMPAPGLYNNGGITSLWHDHIVEEYSLKGISYFYSRDTKNRLTLGTELKSQYLRWIDIKKPWIGAPIKLSSGLYSQSFRLGELSDIWEVKPFYGAFFVADRYRYLGLVADVGGRLEYWFAGKFVDDAINNPESPIRDEIRQSYLSKTHKLGKSNFKMRLLPKVSASFPVKENQVLYFNYGHATVMPHPSYVYTGLNPQFTDRSTLAFLGNPDLDPEVDISYELGLRSQITSNDALNFSAFWRDKYDFITSSSLQVKDVTGREVSRTIRINSDFARIRGFEISYIKRIKSWYRGQISFGYMTATGQSSSASDVLKSILNTGVREDTREFPLPWDRPLDIKCNNLLILNNKTGYLGIKQFNRIKLYIEANYRSGVRYTPYVFTGTEPLSGRPVYELNTDPGKHYSELGKDWFWIDMNLYKWWNLKKMELALNLEVTNMLNNKNAAIINPVTGRGYEYGDPVPNEWKDPLYNDPRDPRSSNLPPDNPARYLPQRHILLGLNMKFRG